MTEFTQKLIEAEFGKGVDIMALSPKRLQSLLTIVWPSLDMVFRNGTEQEVADATAKGVEAFKKGKELNVSIVSGETANAEKYPPSDDRYVVELVV